MGAKLYVEVALCASCEIMHPVAWGERQVVCPFCGSVMEKITAPYIRDLIDPAPPFPVDGDPWGLPYTLYSRVGEGSTGVVYAALHSQRHYLVALKIPARVEWSIIQKTHPRPDPDAVQVQANRIRRESQILSRFLHHRARVLPLVDSGEFQVHDLSVPFLAQPLGMISLRALIGNVARKKQKLPWSIRYRLARLAMEAVASVHSQGASVGGDLAPENMVLYTWTRDHLHVYIIDVESAHVRGIRPSEHSIHSLNAAHTTYFPFRYLLETRSIQRDVFELGVIVVEILLGSSWIRAARDAGFLSPGSTGVEESKLLENFYDGVAVPLLSQLASAEKISPREMTGILRGLKELFISWRTQPETAVIEALKMFPPAGPLTGPPVQETFRDAVSISPSSPPKPKRVTVIFQGDLKGFASRATMESLSLDSLTRDVLVCSPSTVLLTRQYRIVLPRPVPAVVLSSNEDALWLNPDLFLNSTQLLYRPARIRVPISLELVPR